MIYHPIYYNPDNSHRKEFFNPDGSCKSWATLLREGRVKDLPYEMEKPMTAVNLMPGSRIAFDKGCCCPIHLNHAGEGFTDKLFLVSVDCKMHWKNPNENTYVEKSK